MHPSLRCLAASAILLLSLDARAIPAAPFPIELQNGDGTVVRGRLFGDEHLSWAQDLDGWPLAWDQASRSWNYGIPGADGRIAPSPHRAGRADPRTLGLVRHLRPGPKVIERALRQRRAIQGARLAALPTGQMANLVLLVQFNCGSHQNAQGQTVCDYDPSASPPCCSGVNEQTTFTPAAFEQVFNGQSGSVRAYYAEVSYGAFNLTSEVAAGRWIPLPKNDRYYASNSQVENHPEEMLEHAIAWLDANTPGGFDFAPFDKDKDGVIDAIDIIHVGPGYEYSGIPDTIHSHYMPLWSPITSARGMKFLAYHTEPELRMGGKITQIGAIVHETAHFFGAPDLYDYNFMSSGLGMWSLMSMGSWGGPGSNGTVPVHLDGWNKIKIGFVSPTFVTAGGSHVLPPVETHPVVLVVKNGMPGQESFVLENRQVTLFDSYLPGPGLAIYHVDEAMDYVDYDWSGGYSGSNNDPNHYLVDLEQADGDRHLNKNYNDGDSYDVWPTPSASAFGHSSIPSSRPYAGGAGLLLVSAIKRQGSDVAFDVSLSGPGKSLGMACAAGKDCETGFCSGGVCCDTACDTPCHACSAAFGSSTDGRCEELPGSCDDGNACTENDQCQAGICAGQMKRCDLTPCHEVGSCDPSTGSCVTGAPFADGTACNDGLEGTSGDRCVGGACVGMPPDAGIPAPVEETKAESSGCGCSSTRAPWSLFGLLCLLGLAVRGRLSVIRSP